MFNVNDFKLIANYVTNTTECKAMHLHYWETQDAGDEHNNDLYNYLNTLSDAIEDYFSGKLKKEDLVEYGFTGIVSDATCNRLAELHRAASGLSVNDFIFINKGTGEPESMKLYTIKETDDDLTLYKLTYEDKIIVNPVTFKAVKLIDIESNEDSGIVATNAKIVKHANLIPKDFNNGTAFKMYYSHLATNLEKDYENWRFKECMRCHHLFAMSETDMQWYTERELKFPRICMNCRKYAKINKS